MGRYDWRVTAHTGNASSKRVTETGPEWADAGTLKRSLMVLRVNGDLGLALSRLQQVTGVTGLY